MLYGIHTYGLAAVGAMLALYASIKLGDAPTAWALPLFVGCVVASLWPAHLVIALLMALGAGSVWVYRAARSVCSGTGLPALSVMWRRATAVAVAVSAATIAWGVLTDHGLPTGTDLTGYRAVQRRLVRVGVGDRGGGRGLLAIPIAWLRVSAADALRANLYLATMAILVAGAIGWGVRDGDFNQFYVFFSAITVFGAPASAVALWSLWTDARASGRKLVAMGIAALCVAQLEFGAVIAVHRVAQFGPDNREIPMSVLTAIKRLPPGSPIAYACELGVEVTYDTPSLLALTAYSGHPIVPVCFEMDRFGVMAGAELDPTRPNGDWWAPQKQLFPDATTQPSAEAVASFLDRYGIHYLYVDSRHPNTLAPDATSIAESGGYQLLEVP